MHISQKWILGIFLMFQVHAFSQTTPVVIELFTSQGCSSCPPADALLAQIQEEYGADVITLSYHVDYWDYIGWKDPFATKAFTQKQYDYAQKFRSRNVYTPQAVINGRNHYTGSDRPALYRAIQQPSTVADAVSLTLPKVVTEGKKVVVDYTLSDTSLAHELTFAITVKEKTTEVRRGENRNKTLTNSHIVIAEKTVSATTTEGTAYLQLPDWIAAEDTLSIVAYASKDQVGIVSALSRKL